MERHLAAVPRSSILCKNNCGYYGNPSWDNYCSRCYREALRKTQRTQSASHSLSRASSRAFSNFEAKRNKVARKSSSTVRNILKIVKDQYEPGSRVHEESVQAREEFFKLLKTWRSAPANDVSRQITKLLKDINEADSADIIKFSNSIKDFYNHIAHRIYDSSLYQDASTEQKENLINAIERFLSVWIYPWAFTPANTDDEEVDLKLQDRIRSLHWVSHKHLDAPIDPTSPEQSRHLESAILHLIRQNEVQATEAKLDQIVDCCREVFKALRLNTEAAVSKSTSTASNPANADSFLPVLIWVVLRANPPLLHSNLQFIMRFASDTRLNTGEAAYCFTNLVSRQKNF
uniref:Rab5 GDP/GTP exchange factor n=1 Tax=Mesocestoides corti TaxID=53468 RepID=A0A5K3FK71_MESCO